jgi:hypothetical protein
MRLIEQKPITSLRDIGHINIIDFHRCNGLWENNFVYALEVIGGWLIGNSAYTIIHDDLRKYPERNDFPKWEHVGNHKPLAKLYWNMFYATSQGTLTFHDMPDFSGKIILEDAKGEATFWGDIGQVSASVFGAEVLPQMHKGDLWISVVNKDTQIILEFLEDIGMLFGEYLANKFGIE